jgi:hypothetical protein
MGKMTKKELIFAVLFGIFCAFLCITFNLDWISMTVGSLVMILQDVFTGIIKNDEQQF